MCEKNPKPVELSDAQAEQVSGGASMLVSQTTTPSQSSDLARARHLANANIQSRNDTENDPDRAFDSTSVNRPRPRPRG